MSDSVLSKFVENFTDAIGGVEAEYLNDLDDILNEYDCTNLSGKDVLEIQKKAMAKANDYIAVATKELVALIDDYYLTVKQAELKKVSYQCFEIYSLGEIELEDITTKKTSKQSKKNKSRSKKKKNGIKFRVKAPVNLGVRGVGWSWFEDKFGGQCHDQDIIHMRTRWEMRFLHFASKYQRKIRSKFDRLEQKLLGSPKAGLARSHDDDEAQRSPDISPRLGDNPPERLAKLINIIYSKANETAKKENTPIEDIKISSRTISNELNKGVAGKNDTPSSIWNYYSKSEAHCQILKSNIKKNMRAFWSVNLPKVKKSLSRKKSKRCSRKAK